LKAIQQKPKRNLQGINDSMNIRVERLAPLQLSNVRRRGIRLAGVSQPESRSGKAEMRHFDLIQSRSHRRDEPSMEDIS
jgi:hypothetical protein